MRPFSVAAIVFPLLLLVCFSNARKGPGDYWNAVMNGEAMPQVVKDLLHQDAKSDQNQFQEQKFLKDFDTKPNVIIYHKDVGPQEVRSSVQKKFLKDFDTKPNLIIYHRGTLEEVRSPEDKEQLAVEQTKPDLDLLKN